MTDKSNTAPTGGTFKVSRPMRIPVAWYIRIWRWLRRKPTYDVIQVSTVSIKFNASAQELQTAMTPLFLEGDVSGSDGQFTIKPKEPPHAQ